MDIIKYLEESVKLEYNVSELYIIFAEQFTEDYNFWWKIANEELNHASLLKTAIEFAKMNDFKDILIVGDIDDLIKMNNNFDNIIKDFLINPSRVKCFDIALEIENSAGESHYQETMSIHSDNEIVKIFQKLNQEDIDHYNRINKYKNNEIN